MQLQQVATKNSAHFSLITFNYFWLSTTEFLKTIKMSKSNQIRTNKNIKKYLSTHRASRVGVFEWRLDFCPWRCMPINRLWHQRWWHRKLGSPRSKMRGNWTRANHAAVKHWRYHILRHTLQHSAWTCAYRYKLVSVQHMKFHRGSELGRLLQKLCSSKPIWPNGKWELQRWPTISNDCFKTFRYSRGGLNLLSSFYMHRHVRREWLLVSVNLSMKEY